MGHEIIFPLNVIQENEFMNPNHINFGYLHLSSNPYEMVFDIHRHRYSLSWLLKFQNQKIEKPGL